MAYKLGRQVAEPTVCANHGVVSNGLHRTYSFTVGDDRGFSGPHTGEMLSPLTYPPPVTEAASRDTHVIKPATAYADGHKEDASAGTRETKFVAYNDGSEPEASLMQTASVELPSLPVYRPLSKGGDTHKIAMGDGETLQDIAFLTSPIASEDIPYQGSRSHGVPSFPNFLSRVAPISLAAKQDKVGNPRNLQAGVKGQDEQFAKSNGQTKQGKSYIPTFWKPGLQAQPTDDQPRSAVKPAKGTIPTFLKPGWGEAPRKAPVPGKKVAPVKRVLGGGHHVDELHLGTSASKTKLSQTDHLVQDKTVGCRGVLRGLDWKKRGPAVHGQSGSTNVNSDARVLLAQSGPASMVTGSVFPPEIIVTPDACQTTVSVGNARVSVNDLPSTLRLRHTRNATGEKQDATSPSYKWPFVDMTNELFLNFDPKQPDGHASTARGFKHQEPRIVGEEFLENNLHDEVLQELASRERKRQTPSFRPVSQAGLEVVVAAVPSVPLLTVSREGLSPPESKEVHGSSLIVSGAQNSLSTAAVPKQDTDQADFSWFRFSRVDLEDPADEHCRNYRIRRREMRRAKQEAWLARDTRDNGFVGSNGNVPSEQLR